jgi:O-antigen/teichoic acid export membrane protein
MRFLRTTQNPLTRNVASLVGATAIAQAVQLGVTPFLTRIYGPDEFAVFQVFFSIAAIVSVLATLRYEVAITATDRPSETRPLLIGSIGISILIALVVFLALVAISVLGLKEITSFYILSIPIFIGLSGASQALTNLSIRSGTFQRNFWSRILSSLVQSVTALVLGLLGALSTGLMLSVIAGQIILTVVLGKGLPHLIPEEKIELKGILKVLKRHQKFPKYNAPHALIDVLQDHGIIFLLGIFFGNNLLAFYSQAYRLLKAPVGFIGSAIHQVFFPDFNRRWIRNEDLRPSVKKLYGFLALIGLPFFGILFIFSGQIFTWFLGEDWNQVGVVAKIIMPWLYLNFIASPLSSLSIVASRQGTAMLLAIIEFILRSTCILIGGLMDNSHLALVMMSTISCLFLLYKLYWYYKISQKQIEH